MIPSKPSEILFALAVAVNVNVAKPDLYRSLLPSALDFIATINIENWINDTLNLNGLINLSNSGANDLLFALINRGEI